ncbi:MAG: MCP four helix bundle domain-containing protein, partial [Methylotenera sp.]|nr:MCP four helix bundle domain-containing protein [Methylotenera sp.]
MKLSIQSLKVGKRLMVLIGLAIVTAATLTELGIYNQSKTNTSLEAIYKDRMIPVGDLNTITINQKDINLALGFVQSEVDIVSNAGKSSTKLNEARVADTIKAVNGYIADNEKLWTGYMATYLTPEEKILAEKYSENYLKYINDGVKPTIQALRTYNQDAVKKSYENGLALNILADDEMQKLVKLQYSIADQEHDNSVALYKSARTTAILTLGVLIALLIWLGFAVTRSITKTLGCEPEEMYDTANRIAKGDLDFNIALAANDKSSAMAAMAVMQGKIKLLVIDAAMLADAAKKGLLSTRADANQHQGDFRKVVEGVNQTLDDVIGPLNVAAGYVDRISKGDIPAKITDNYNGDFNTIKNNLNACIDAVNNMVSEANNLEKAAIEGRLATRADASKYQGDFRKVVVGVNNCLDAVIGPLNVAAGYVDNFAKGTIPAKITDSYNGDFNILKNNLNACIGALNLLVSDANMLAQAAKDNRLDTRADATQHLGDYRKVVEGVNGTLDTVMQKTAADASDKAQEAKVLEDAVEETQAIIEGAKTGDLSSRVSLEGKTGAIASLCDGVNALMDKMTEVIVQVREAGETINTAAGEISSGNNDLSQRTEQQASSLEETAASMEQLASTVKNNAENAKQANQLAAAASGVAVKGGQVVGQVVNTMSAINSSAKKIEDIIS